MGMYIVETGWSVNVWKIIMFFTEIYYLKIFKKLHFPCQWLLYTKASPSFYSQLFSLCRMAYPVAHTYKHSERKNTSKSRKTCRFATWVHKRTQTHSNHILPCPENWKLILKMVFIVISNCPRRVSIYARARNKNCILKEKRRVREVFMGFRLFPMSAIKCVLLLWQFSAI